MTSVHAKYQIRPTNISN